jgi:MFS family permease
MLAAIDFGYGMSFPDPAFRYLSHIFTAIKCHEWSVLQDAFCLIYLAYAAFGPTFTNGLIGRLGRKKLLFTYALASVICWLMFFVIPLDSPKTKDIWFLVVVRGISGLSMGALSALTPMYLVELAPKDATGFFGTLNQVGISIGFVICYLFGLRDDPRDAKHAMAYWRLLVGIGVVSPFVLMFLVWIVQEPSDVEQDPPTPSHADRHQLHAPILDGPQGRFAQPSPSRLSSLPWSTRLVGCCVLMLFHQTTGVNLILVNLARRFTGGSSSTNQYDKKIRWLSVGSSFTQVVTSMLGAFLINLGGRLDRHSGPGNRSSNEFPLKTSSNDDCQPNSKTSNLHVPFLSEQIFHMHCLKVARLRR